MKRMLCMILMLCLMCPWAGAEPILDMENPWTETTPEAMVETIGLSFSLPEGAEEIAYRMLESEALAEVQFVLNGSQCTARIRPSMGFEDISGMYYDWTMVEDCEILWCPGKVMQTEADGQYVALCLWYDVVPGLMYSVSVIGEISVLALADVMFTPAQGDVDAQPGDILRQKLEGCMGYEGTAGSSLKEAIAATELLAFAVEYADEENLQEIVKEVMLSFTVEEQSMLEHSLSGIRLVVETALSDYASVAGLFDDAGVGEQMQALVETETAAQGWMYLWTGSRE